MLPTSAVDQAAAYLGASMRSSGMSMEPSGSIRCNSCMRRLTTLLFVGLAVVGAAGSAGGVPKTQPQRLRVTVYFLVDDQKASLGVRETAERRGTKPVAEAALQRLLAGPPIGHAGLTSAIPAGTRVRSLSVVHQTARVNLAGLPSLSSVSGTTVARIGTQIARTLIGLSGITRIRIESNGEPWNFRLMSGGISTRAWDYGLLVGLWVGNFKALP